MQGQQMNVDATYANGRVKGSGTTPTPQGMKSVSYDTTTVAGMIDDNAIQAILPALKWAPGAKHVMNVFQSGKGTAITMTAAVAGEEKVTVPAGEFDTYKVEVTGGEQPTTFYLTKDSPHRIMKVTIAGAPIEIVRVK
jgi:hypothetical protein